MRRLIGYTLLLLSALASASLFVLPFAGVTLGEGAVIAVVLVVLSEAGFLLGIALIGRETWERFTHWLRSLH